MKNMAYTEDYLDERKRQAAIFCSEYFIEEKLITLSPQYKIKSRSYRGKVGEYTLHATENDLIDNTGAVIYTYKNLNDDCEFTKIIEHQNGNSYMIFRSELYGYSVLDLSTLKDFRYSPAGSFPEGETFIWTDVFYNKNNNILAVSGCYWAAPFGILLQDFSDPMTEPTVWADIQKHIEDGYDRFDYVDFASWNDTDLHLNALDAETEEEQSIVISEKEYAVWLKKVEI